MYYMSNLLLGPWLSLAFTLWHRPRGVNRSGSSDPNPLQIRLLFKSELNGADNSRIRIRIILYYGELIQIRIITMLNVADIRFYPNTHFLLNKFILESENPLLWSATLSHDKSSYHVILAREIPAPFTLSLLFPLSFPMTFVFFNGQMVYIKVLI